MTSRSQPTCKVMRPRATYAGKQGFTYVEGISAESAGARGICMHLVTIPPGRRGRAHMHESHETALYVLSGVSEMWYGSRLEHHLTVKAGEMLYIPAGMPHLPANAGPEPVTAVISRTDPHEQESVVLLPQLDRLVPR